MPVRLLLRAIFLWTLLLGLCPASGAQALPDTTMPRDSDEQQTIDVYEHTSRAVVGITAIADGQPTVGAGTIIDPDGLILTSRHVVGDAREVQVSWLDADGDTHTLTGSVLGRMGDTLDLALIRVRTPVALTALTLGDSSQIRVGQKVLAIGNPYGFERTLTQGVISRLDAARNRIQTDAALNPGNSGGPLMDRAGRLIGVNQSIFNPDGARTYIGIGFAVPVNAAKQFIQTLAVQANAALPHPAQAAKASTPPHPQISPPLALEPVSMRYRRHAVGRSRSRFLYEKSQ